VEDQGIGIAPQYHDKLFGVFQRLHAEGDYSGHGIGLAIVRKSIELMGGRVGVISEVNVGCRFWIELKQANHVKSIV
jgi:signal transduction histidine kinase